MTNYKINSNRNFTHNNSTYVIVSATFFRTTGDMTMVELYKVEEGLEMFQGYLRADCTEDLRAKGPAARQALNLMVFEEMAAAA